ncbi:MAG: hypothetical protein HYY68_05175 [Thaumarchaeota archaeon]|nr:hypothetical protein [Nitrososphaerota archaeon]
MAFDLNDDQLKAAIMEFILKKGRWGAHYYPIDTLVNFLGRKIRKDGKRVKAAIRVLVNDRYLLVHKRGDTISLNPARSKEIMDLLNRKRSGQYESW